MCSDELQRVATSALNMYRNMPLLYDAEGWCVSVQEQSPAAAVHAYKTTIPPLLKDCRSSDGAFEAAAMGKRAHVLALNAVSRHLAGVQVRSPEY